MNGMKLQFVFSTRAEFRKWLSENADKSPGIWLIFGKDETVKTLSAAEALEEALCFGWIDGKIKGVDESRYLKYFSRRRKGSAWSEKNKNTIQKLIEKGLVTPLGMEAIHESKSAGNWDTEKKEIPFEEIEKFEILLKDDPAAYDNFLKTSISHQKQLVGFYCEAKQEETRTKRLNKIVQALREKKKTILY